eukprot:TRINITY_DN13244_c0_g1_i3.p1 TRINITY_DN13244_c0_g1~~TRINITY_DN13244_c0_g1_i3.p1  ORF type:complete len:794 (-),score=195.17 TRINITY_DN13244_c0_g1_i3:108-2489(-)
MENDSWGEAFAMKRRMSDVTEGDEEDDDGRPVSTVNLPALPPPLALDIHGRLSRLCSEKDSDGSLTPRTGSQVASRNSSRRQTGSAFPDLGADQVYSRSGSRRLTGSAFPDLIADQVHSRGGSRRHTGSVADDVEQATSRSGSRRPTGQIQEFQHFDPEDIEAAATEEPTFSSPVRMSSKELKEEKLKETVHRVLTKERMQSKEELASKEPSLSPRLTEEADDLRGDDGATPQLGRSFRAALNRAASRKSDLGEGTPRSVLRHLTRPESAHSNRSLGSDEGSWRVLTSNKSRQTGLLEAGEMYGKRDRAMSTASGQSGDDPRRAMGIRKPSFQAGPGRSPSVMIHSDAESGRPKTPTQRREDRQIRCPVATVDLVVPPLVLPAGAMAEWQLHVQAAQRMPQQRSQQDSQSEPVLPPLGWYCVQLNRASGQAMRATNQQIGQLQDWYGAYGRHISADLLLPILEQALEACNAVTYWLQVVLQAIAREEVNHRADVAMSMTTIEGLAAGSGGPAVSRTRTARKSGHGSKQDAPNPLEKRLGRSTFLQLREVANSAKPKLTATPRGIRAALSALHAQTAKVQACGPAMAGILAQFAAPEAFGYAGESRAAWNDDEEVAKEAEEEAMEEVHRLLVGETTIDGVDHDAGDNAEALFQKFFLLVPCMDLVVEHIGTAFRLFDKTQAFCHRPSAPLQPFRTQQDACQAVDDFCRFAAEERRRLGLDAEEDASSIATKEDGAADGSEKRDSSASFAAVKAVAKFKKGKKNASSSEAPSRPETPGTKKATKKKAAGTHQKKK